VRLPLRKTKLLRQASLTTTGHGVICSGKVYFAEFKDI